jgi:SpoVK/Ycf46/Vps4 family AAA+-type ATPase
MEDEASLMTCEFELTDEFLESIKTKRKRNRMRESARTPKVTMKQVVHTEETRAAIQLAITQTQHGAVLMDDWGLAGTVTYGRSVSVLFSGPPGVGKTATAEAIAHELSKKILVANYAEIQNCFVGQTEKNISRFFREARESDAVLFWDEADSMFFDRNSAYRNWEVREVNQLLMELEKFEGLCILATNRTVTLDKALQRRIAIKVEFQPPDADMRMQIWRKLIPKKLPLDKDIDWETLADTELTGGEIKNSVLNASRFALVRGPQGPVTMNDFEKAISLEVDGRWGESRTGVIGFGR